MINPRRIPIFRELRPFSKRQTLKIYNNIPNGNLGQDKYLSHSSKFSLVKSIRKAASRMLPFGVVSYLKLFGRTSFATVTAFRNSIGLY